MRRKTYFFVWGISYIIMGLLYNAMASIALAEDMTIWWSALIWCITYWVCNRLYGPVPPKKE